MEELAYREHSEGSIRSAGGFSGHNWTPQSDVRSFTILFSEIAIAVSAGQGSCSRKVPSFVSGIIERGQSLDSKAVDSFSDILENLKENNFEIMEGVDIHEVSAFMNWIELSESLTE
jgi:hypothetical protein